MVAAQVFIALCVASVAVAAPQLDFAGPRSVSTTRGVGTSNINEQEVVSNVVSALQPSIAKAVADALAGLQTSTFTSSAADAERAAFEAEIASDVGVNARPVYNFEYKVADNDAQTYISQSEERDGDALTGMYSYVNPDGALITVNYEAGPMGYSQTLDQQDGFVSINPRPVKASVATSSSSSASGSRVTSSSSGSRFSGASSSTGVASGISSTSSSSSLDQSALIAQIISALQPQISSAVQSAISSTRTTTSAVVAPRLAPVAVAPPRRVAPVAVAGGDLSSTFGNGFSVKIDTPEFNIEY